MTRSRDNATNVAGDISGVTAGTGISGGGTSGTVTVTNDMATTIDAAGDLIYGTANDAYARLAIGTARQTLLANSGATAPEWAASPQSLMTATGDILYASAANTPARLAIGTTSQVLTVASGIPSWASASASATTYTTLVDNVSLSGSTHTFSSLGGYNKLKIIMRDAQSNSTADMIRFRINGTDTGYYNLWGYVKASSPYSTGSANQGKDGNWGASGSFVITFANGTSKADCIIDFDGCNGSGRKPYNFFSSSTGASNASGATFKVGGGFWDNSATVSSISILVNASTFADGSIWIYGAN